MMYKINYTLMGAMESIGNIPIRRSSGLRIDSIGSIDITYSFLLGRVLTIDCQDCAYTGWLSPVMAVGDIVVRREPYKFWTSRSQMLSVGELKVKYDNRGRLSSIGSLQFKYGTFGRAIEMVVPNDRSLSYQEQIALILNVIEIEEMRSE